MREKLSEYLTIRSKASQYQLGGSQPIIPQDTLDELPDKLKNNIKGIETSLQTLESIMEIQCNKNSPDELIPILANTLGNIKTRLEGLQDKVSQDKQILEQAIEQPPEE